MRIRYTHTLPPINVVAGSWKTVSIESAISISILRKISLSAFSLSITLIFSGSNLAARCPRTYNIDVSFREIFLFQNLDTTRLVMYCLELRQSIASVNQIWASYTQYNASHYIGVSSKM